MEFHRNAAVGADEEHAELWDAVRDAVDLLVEEKGLSEEEAYLLITIKADVEICQVVDPLMTVRVAMDRGFFESLAPTPTN
mgnify:CR=1 FL=1